MSQPMQRCQNCLKQFEESKMATHFGYCRRNIKRCQLCKEMYDINYKEQHQQQFHKKTPCQFCKKQFGAAELQKHKITCSRLTKFCEYCQLNVPMNEYATHLKACQSRTKKCDKCTKPIANKDYLVHIVSCPGVVQQPKNYNQYIKDQRGKDYRQENKSQNKYANYQPEPKIQPERRRQVLPSGSANNGLRYDQQPREAKSPINLNPHTTQNRNVNPVKVQDYHGYPQQGNNKHTSSNNNIIVNPKYEQGRYQVPGNKNQTYGNKYQIPKSSTNTNPKSSNNIVYPSSTTNSNPQNYPNSIRTNPSTDTYSSPITQPYSNQQKDQRNIYGAPQYQPKKQIRQPQIKTYDTRKVQPQGQVYYNNKPVDNTRKEQGSNRQGLSPANIQPQYNPQNRYNQPTQPVQPQPQPNQYNNKYDRYDNKYDNKYQPNKNTKPTENNYMKYQQPKKQQKKAFDPTEYGGYVEDIPADLLLEDEQTQRVIMQSMGLTYNGKSSKNDPKKRVLKQYEALYNMEDVQKQKQIQQEIKRRNAYKR